MPKAPAVHKNKLFFGDNLDILRDYLADANDTVDLVYLDPPFKSNATYNVLYSEKSGKKSVAQITAFEDTWHWGPEAEKSYHEVVTSGPKRLADLLVACRGFLGTTTDMMAYLTMMAPRLVELQRVLKPTGSIYLHCDPTASHYLKMLMDAVFDPRNFRSEIIWRRTGAHGGSRRFSPIHDVILFYSKTDDYKWKKLKKPYMKGHVKQYFVQTGEGWRTNYYGNVLTGSGVRTGESGKPWRGFDPTAKARHWAVPGAIVDEIDEDMSGLSQHEKLDRLYELGFIKIEKGQAWPMYERYLTPADGQAIPDIWAYQPYTEGTVFGTDEGVDEDVRWLSPQDQERLGYPTQKPEGLLERIVLASTDEGDLVLDPFCGCGTTVAVAEKLKRRWVGIDITHLAVAHIRARLNDLFRMKLSPYEVLGDPKDFEGARALAEQDRYQFEWWAVGMADGQPKKDKKKGADTGIDGMINFFDDATGKPKKIIIQVKSGTIQPTYVRDLKGVVQREDATIGVLITLNEPTKAIRHEATIAGFYTPKLMPDKTYPKIQVLTVEQLLAGERPQYPRMGFEHQYKKAKPKPTKQVSLLD